MDMRVGGCCWILYPCHSILSAFDCRLVLRECNLPYTGCVMIIKQAWAQATLMWVIGLVSLYAYYK